MFIEKATSLSSEVLLEIQRAELFQYRLLSTFGEKNTTIYEKEERRNNFFFLFRYRVSLLFLIFSISKISKAINWRRLAEKNAIAYNSQNRE